MLLSNFFFTVHNNCWQNCFRRWCSRQRIFKREILRDLKMMIVVVMRMMIFVHLMMITISSYSFHNCYSCKWVIKKPAIKVADLQHKAPQFLGFLYQALKLWIIITLAIYILCEPTKKILKLSLSVCLSLCLWQQQPSFESHAQEHGLGTQRAAFLICFYRKLTFLLGMSPCWGREVVAIMHEPFRTSSSAEKICHNNFVVDEEDWHPPWQDRCLREIKRILPQPNGSFCFQTTTHVFLLP